MIPSTQLWPKNFYLPLFKAFLYQGALSGSASVSLSFKAVQFSASAIRHITERRLCKMAATNRKIEHIPNITLMGNAATLYSTMQTKMLRGILKKFIMVLLASSGIYWDLIFIMDGQKIPTQASNVQNPRSNIQPANVMPPPFTFEGAMKKLVTIGSRRAAEEITNTTCM
nr:hypothetical protein Iba_chr11aCG4910 [Ipomoea batatas]